MWEKIQEETMSKNKNSLSRRDVLKLLGYGSLAAMTPVEIFLENLIQGILAKGFANETKEFSKKYVLIQEYAAPPRWSFDLFLNPYEPDSIVMANGSVKTQYSGSNRYTNAIYKTHKVKGINAPIIWTQNVGSGSSGSRKFSDLMNNMIVLQGMDSLNPGHFPAAELMNRPLTNESIDGVLADQSNLPFSCLQFRPVNLNFKSKKGLSQKSYPSLTNVENLIAQAFEVNYSSLEKKYHNEINDAVKKLNRRIANHKMGGQALEYSLDSAESLIASEIRKIKTEIPTLEAKYQNVIDNTVSLSANLPGFSDKPIGKTGSRNGDNNYRLTRNNRIVNDSDMRNILPTVTHPNMAKSYALLEYVLVNNLTSNASIRATEIQARINGSNRAIAFDQHRTGVMNSILFNTMYYRSMGALNLELIDALKKTPFNNGNMFDHTVIRQGGEFGRHPRTDGTGSDHSPWSNNCTLFSGMIDGPLILGDIHKDGRDRGYRTGSFGVGSKLKYGLHATTGHVISSLATLLDVESPSPNNPSLLTKSANGKVVQNTSYIDKTKVV